MWAGGVFRFTPLTLLTPKFGIPILEVGREVRLQRSTFSITKVMGSKNSFSYRIKFEEMGHI